MGVSELAAVLGSQGVRGRPRGSEKLEVMGGGCVLKTRVWMYGDPGCMAYSES